MVHKTSVYMMYDIEEDKAVARKLANGSEVPQSVKNDIENKIEEIVDKKEAENVVEEAQYEAPLVRIGMARFNHPDNIEYDERDYIFEGGYKYAHGYEI